MNVGELIKSSRLEKGMTQEELAEKVGVKKSAVAKWENGRVSEIKRSNLKNLADALGLDPNQLLGDNDSSRFVEEKPVKNDGLTENHRKLIDFAEQLSEDQAEKVLRLMQSILAFDE